MLNTVSLGIAVVTLMLSAGTQAQQDNKDIVETAMAAGSFKTLAKALQAADLVDTLKGQGPFTVFAPTILTYHVVPGRVSSADVVMLRTAKAVSGDTIDINANGGSVMVDSARVVKADVQASNGVIHVIDSVILPDGSK